MFLLRSSHFFSFAFFFLSLSKQKLQCHQAMSVLALSLVGIQFLSFSPLIQGSGTVAAERKCLHLRQWYMYLMLLHLWASMVSFLRLPHYFWFSGIWLFRFFNFAGRIPGYILISCLESLSTYLHLALKYHAVTAEESPVLI